MIRPGVDSAPELDGKAPRALSREQFELLQSLSRSLLAAPTYTDLFPILGDFYRDIGAGAVNCAVFDNKRLELVGVSTTMKARSVTRYFEENMARDDPLIPRLHANPRPAILGWGFGVTSIWQAGESARMLEGMERDGYHGLLYFPVPVAGSPFSVTITVRNELEPERGQAFLNAQYGFLQLAAAMAGQRAAMLFQGGQSSGSTWQSFRRPVLSGREREVIALLIDGERTGRIAQHLAIQPVTVQMHLASARRKLGARTREELISLALKRGYIVPPRHLLQ